MFIVCERPYCPGVPDRGTEDCEESSKRVATEETLSLKRSLGQGIALHCSQLISESLEGKRCGQRAPAYCCEMDYSLVACYAML